MTINFSLDLIDSCFARIQYQYMNYYIKKITKENHLKSEMKFKILFNEGESNV